jgi:hypothetical protein
VAEERTAKLRSPSAVILLVGGLDLGSSLAGKGVSTIHWRICAPVLGQGIDVIHVSVVERGVDALGQAFVGEELAVGLGGGGEAARDTRTLEGSWLIISPSEAFLPPTCSTSDMRSSLKGIT